MRREAKARQSFKIGESDIVRRQVAEQMLKEADADPFSARDFNVYHKGQEDRLLALSYQVPEDPDIRLTVIRIHYPKEMPHLKPGQQPRPGMDVSFTGGEYEYCIVMAKEGPMKDMRYDDGRGGGIRGKGFMEEQNVAAWCIAFTGTTNKGWQRNYLNSPTAGWVKEIMRFYLQPAEMIAGQLEA